MNARFETVDHRFDAIDLRFETIDHRFDAIDLRFETIDHRFDAMGSRFDAMGSRFDAIESRFTAVESRFGSVETQMATTFDSFRAELRGGFADMQRRTIQWSVGTMIAMTTVLTAAVGVFTQLR